MGRRLLLVAAMALLVGCGGGTRPGDAAGDSGHEMGGDRGQDVAGDGTREAVWDSTDKAGGEGMADLAELPGEAVLDGEAVGGSPDANDGLPVDGKSDALLDGTGGLETDGKSDAPLDADADAQGEIPGAEVGGDPELLDSPDGTPDAPEEGVVAVEAEVVDGSPADLAVDSPGQDWGEGLCDGLGEGLGQDVADVPEDEAEPVTVCGNGKVEPGEQCDDGGATIGQCGGCNEWCQWTMCGWCWPSPCCGNGIVEPANDEECDDGNTTNGDGCSQWCKLECGGECCSPCCGDGWPDPGEECDDGNKINGDGCSASCQLEVSPVCGNGVVEPENDEQCDDGNTQNGDGCNQWCKKECCNACWPSPCCGDGIIDAGEECDDGNLIDGDGCSDLCKLECCGTGIAGKVSISGQVTAADKLLVMAWNKKVTDPLHPGLNPVAGLVVEYAASPQSFKLNLPASGMYWVGAVIDACGDGVPYDSLDDKGVMYPGNPVMVPAGMMVGGIDMSIEFEPVPCGP